ncbi:hypothetical protein [Candidatus Nitrososphaera evergladensis]|nr:hypothetical protein [Candidatus Nitrososphaera evergladensis]
MVEYDSDSSDKHGTAAGGGNSNNDIRSNNNSNNSSAGASPHPSHGHFLYADYTPLEDNRNLIEMIKNFVSLAAQVIKYHETDVKCISLLDDSELLRKELISAIRNTRAATTDTIDRFYERNSNIFSSVTGLQSAGGNTFLTDAKASLDRMLTDVEANSSQQQEKYNENIKSTTNANRIAAINAVQGWLSDENRNFPGSVLANLSIELEAHIDPATHNNNYKVIRTASTSVSTPKSAVAVTNKDEEGEKEAGAKAAAITSTMPFTYVFEFESAGIEFWNYRKKVVDLGIKELMLPVGMKLPMSEKVKNTFRLGSKKEESAKEPHFTKADDFYMSSVVLRDDKTLEVQLASDISAGHAREGKGELFTITFDMVSLPDSSAHSGNNNISLPSSSTNSATFSTTRPTIHYTDNRDRGEEGQATAMVETDLLRIKEIEQATDLRKLTTFGTAVLTKMQILRDPKILALKGKLKLLAVEEKEAIAMSRRNVSGGAAAEPTGSGFTATAATAIMSPLVFIEFRLLFDLLEALARSFGPAIGKLREKTPVKEELILRQELEGGQRKEFAVRLADLRLQLEETTHGKSISRTLFGEE